MGGKRCLAGLVVAMVAAGCPPSDEAILDRWNAVDRGEVDRFWFCLFGTEVGGSDLINPQQVRRLMESAHGGRKESYPEHVLTTCLPGIEAARQAVARLAETRGRWQSGLSAYAASLAGLQRAVAVFVAGMKERRVTRQLDAHIQQSAQAWDSSTAPTPGSIAHHRFLRCALPALDALEDARALAEHLGDLCFKGNPLPFMDRIRRTCAPALASADSPAEPDEAYQTARKRLAVRPGGRGEQVMSQALSWASCTDIAQATRRMVDAEPLVAAVSAYLRARPGAKP
jgi:hypothetical protein